MRVRVCLGALLLLVASVLRAGDTLMHAEQAQAMLGPEIWSRVLRVSNTARGGEYPPVVHALVFEFAGILWFYADVNGTQSLSVRTDHLAEDKADFGALLHEIEPGFTGYCEIKEAHTVDGGAGHPPNDCFIASVAALRALLERGEMIEQAQLLSYYVRRGAHQLGHTLLTYVTEQGMFALDPEFSAQPRQIKPAQFQDALALAQHLSEVDGVVKARWVAVTLPPPVVFAATGGAAELSQL